MFKFDTNKVRGLMAEKGISQGELGNILGIAPGSVYNKLNGRTQFNVNEVCTLALMFDAEPKIFFTRDVNESDTPNFTSL